MGKPKELTGKRFGNLTAINIAGKDTLGHYMWKCQCDCGEIRVVRGSSLLTGNTRSCGCYLKQISKLLNTTHGMSNTQEEVTWRGIKQRCFNPNIPNYKNYGGRGITICERWLKFENFLKDMGLKPTPHHSIERINNNGNYCPENCKWATKLEQQNNRRNTYFITINGETKTFSEWCKITGKDYLTVYRNIKQDGFLPERAFGFCL